ncbi:MAG: flagellar biosynthetic protein FliR [Geminicoccaceae bacterium]
MLPHLVTAELFSVLLVFGRIGAALMLVPGFGEHYVLARLRLLIALAVSVLLAPTLKARLPAMPVEPLGLAALIAGEVVLGLMLGVLCRLVMAAVHVGGTVIAMQSGLAAAAFFDPAEATQGTLPGNFIAVLVLTLLFTTGLYRELMLSLAASYGVLPAGAGLPSGDLARALLGLVSEAFGVALRMAAPLVVAGLLVNLALGALNRLVPSFQVFFVSMPVQLLLSLALLLVSLVAVAHLALEILERTLRLIGGV